MTRWIYLSHVLNEDTVKYGGGSGLNRILDREIKFGDSCNESSIRMQLHLGTHIDAPFHFYDDSATIDAPLAEFWVFENVHLLTVSAGRGEQIDLARLGDGLMQIPLDCDLLLIKTGAESLRGCSPSVYSAEGPFLGADFAEWIKANLRLKAVGIDSISVASPAQKAIGRRVHRTLLGTSGGDPVFLIEDMTFERLVVTPKRVIALPLRLSGADGSPASIIAEIN